MQPSKSAQKRGKGIANANANKRPRTAGTRAAWITDPGALLEALDAGEARERARVEPPPESRPQPVMAMLEEQAMREEQAAQSEDALPALRSDERIGHASQGVVVIIRRRRAA